MVQTELDEAWLADWAADASTVVERITQTFKSRFGFEPDTNEIRLATDNDRDAGTRLTQDPIAAPDLAPLYRVIGAVTLPDVGNGLFVHSARDTLDQHQIEGELFLPEADDPHGIVIGSNGGGQLFVADWGGAVHRSRIASIHSEFDPIAGNLQDFLELIRQDIQLFADTGRVGVL